MEKIHEIRSQIREYLEKENLTPTRFAKIYGFPVPVITRFLNQTRNRPGIQLETYLRLKKILEDNGRGTTKK